MSTQNTSQQAIREFLTTSPFYNGTIPRDLDESFPLLDSGALDSLGVYNLVNFIETTFSVQIEVEDLSKGSFGTLATITEFVDQKISAKGR